MKNKYEIKFLVKGIVSITVIAETQEEAIKIGKDRMKEIPTFNNKLSYLDGTETFIGINNLDLWNEVRD